MNNRICWHGGSYPGVGSKDGHPVQGLRSMSAPTFRVHAGTRGLNRELLHHLVQSRYAAASAGSPAWAVRSFDQVHEAAGHTSAPTAEHTRAALDELESLGLIHAIRRADGDHFAATPEGVRAVNQEYVEPTQDDVSAYFGIAA